MSLLSNRYVTLAFCVVFGSYTYFYWDDPAEQFRAGLNAGFFIWALLQTVHDFAKRRIKTRNGDET
jgi:hypothetical protein